MNKLLVTPLLVLILGACGIELPPIVGCEAVGEIKPVCGMQTPEDIAALPDDQFLLLSNFSGMSHGTGTIGLFDTRSDSLVQLFPALDGTGLESQAGWGESSCPPPDSSVFRPHGTHLHQLDDGRWRYLVVNHGGRESIELFELLPAGAESELLWRGCVLPTADTVMNDVVGLDNGDIVFTRMFHEMAEGVNLKSLLRMDTGDIWRWSAGGGLRLLPGTDASMPNGIEISADNRYVFANMYFEEEVWKIDADTGEVVGKATAAFADNSAWGSDGRLWIASHSGGLLELSVCLKSQVEPCAASFEIIALDPESMATELVFAHRGPPMGAATVAVPLGGRVYLGSFVGDRLVSVPDFAKKP